MVTRNCMMMTAIVMIQLFKKYRKKGPEFHAFAKFSGLTSLGRKTGGYVMVSAKDFTEVRTIQRNGRIKMAARMHSPIILISDRTDRFVFFT